jgi:hypothetical protein
MKSKFLLFVLGCLSGFSLAVTAQPKGYPAILIGKIPVGKFMFDKGWAYRWNIIKHDDGRFENTIGDGFKPADTAHLYFTANCKTNVQGGYLIRYCYAGFKTDTVVLNFADGAPAYNNEFKLYLIGHKFYIEPNITYPELVSWQKTTYRITNSELLITSRNYANAKTIRGYVNIEFDEVTKEPRHKPHINKLYLRGYFKTPLQKGYAYAPAN